MDDPLDQAFSVIEEVTQKIVDRFGEEGKKFIDPNRIFVNAEYHLTNGYSKAIPDSWGSRHLVSSL